MKIKKAYSFSNKRQIWRIIPAGSDKFIIEEREPDKKEVFFNCIDAESGKKIFKNLQFEEKFWIGIEAVYKDIIYFHRFLKPDMPGHRGIIAYDINLKKIIWETNDYNFLFVNEDKLYSYRQNFESKSFYVLNYKTGELEKELADDPGKINFFRKQANIDKNYEDYKFPEQFIPGSADDKIDEILNNIKHQHFISDKIEYVRYENLLLFNFHVILSSGEGLKNVFKAVDIDSGKVIFEEDLNSGIRAFIPDSFFVKSNFVILLKDKTKLLVLSVT